MDSTTSSERHGRRWTATEEDQLRWWWGVKSAAAIGVLIGRTEQAVISHGVHVLKLGSPNRGNLSMAELERRSGFKRSTILLVAAKHGIPLRRVPRYQRSRRPRTKDPRSGARNYSISPEVAERLIALLVERPAGRHRRETRGAWGEGRKPPACLDCGTPKRKHCARGLCTRCYKARHDAGTLDALARIVPNNAGPSKPPDCNPPTSA